VTSQKQGTSPYRAGIERTGPVLVTTGNDIAGHRVVEYLGVVRGIVVRSLNIGQGVVGGLKQIFGGNISEYIKVCEEARHEAKAERDATRQHLAEQQRREPQAPVQG
jgi:hypothetical protein